MLLQLRQLKQTVQKLYTIICNYFFNQGAYDQYEFLPSYLELIERPPSPSARITAITISILILLAFIWSYLGKLDIHATANGRLVLPSRSQLIQAYELSEVVEILVKDGQNVKAGDKLLVLNAVGSAQEIVRCKEQLSFQQLELARYRALLTNDPVANLIMPDNIEQSVSARAKSLLISIWDEHQTTLQKLDSELAANQSEQTANQISLRGLQKLQQNIQQRVIPSRKLASSNFVSKSELLSKEKEALEITLSISTKQEELKILQARALTIEKNKTSYIAQKYREWHDNLNKAESALLIAQQELIKTQERRRLQILRAPLDGLVQQIAVHTIGGVVQGAQTLMIVAPHDAPQQAEIDIANKHIGFVHPGQLVTVKIEAFPYSRYGTINGKIISLSRDSVKQNEHYNTELVFLGQVELDQNYIIINGKPVVLTPGMTITAEIKIGKRRVIDYLLSPIREYKSEAWREP